MIDSINSAYSSSNMASISRSGDNERAERTPDNEAAEIRAQNKAPLPNTQGTTVDMMA